MDISKFIEFIDRYYRYFITKIICVNKSTAYQRLDDFETAEYIL